MVRIEETIRKYGLIRNGDKVLIGVSGGPDSLVLLLKLAYLRSKMCLKLHIAHVNHNLRKDSIADASFVQRWAEKLNIPLSLKKLDPRILKKKGSIEEILREARMDFFIKIAKKIKADSVALGHNLEDQAETILMRLLRGTGLSGLAGISVKRNIKGVIFIRPLMETSRCQIDKFLKEKGIKPHIDSTNRQDLFLRNRIRHNLIPLLKKEYNRNIVRGLANLAESASYDYEYLDQIAKRSAKGNILRLNLKKITKLHPSILRLKLRQSIGYIQGNTRRISFTNVKEIEDLIFCRPGGAIVNLPKGICVQKTHAYLRFFKH